MAKQLVKIVKTAEDVVTPTYATTGDAGLDLYSNDYLEIQPGHRATVNIGLKMEIPGVCTHGSLQGQGWPPEME
jgi:dUTPase